MTAPFTWPRELPVLQAAVTAMDDGSGLVMLGDLEAATGMPAEDVRRAVIALHRGGVIEAGPMIESAAGTQVHFVKDLSREAYELSGAWPTPETGADRLIQTLEHLAFNAPTEDQRSRARKMLDAATGSGRDIAVSVAAAVISGQIS